MTHPAILVQELGTGRVHRCPVGVPVLAGRDKACRIKTSNLHVSRRHCELYAEPDGRLRLTDLSKRGMTLDGVRLVPERAVWARTGQTFRLGPELELRVVGVLDPDASRRNPDGSLAVPQELPPHYLLLGLIGRGAAGLVYEAYDEERRQRCAIKLLVVGGPASEELVARFQREAILQAKLGDYPGIVTVRDFGLVEDGGEMFFMMDFVTGTTLQDEFRERRLTRKQLVRHMARVARAVHYAHEHAVVHRDLKPSNVLVSEKGVIRLTDFGVCKALEGSEGITGTGATLGTPNYMAPEQIDDSKRVGTKADVYGLGAILYVALTGALPFHGDSVAEVLDKVTRGDLTHPREVDPSVPDTLAQVCVQAMQRDPDQRPASALALAKVLEAWLKESDPPTRVKLRLPGM